MCLELRNKIDAGVRRGASPSYAVSHSTVQMASSGWDWSPCPRRWWVCWVRWSPVRRPRRDVVASKRDTDTLPTHTLPNSPSHFL